MLSIPERVDIIWDYMRLHQTLTGPVDAIIVLGSSDTRMAYTAAQLFANGYSDQIIMSGGFGSITKDRFTKPEARVFADIAIEQGVPASNILIEDQSTNTGENIRFTFQLLRSKNLHPSSFILVQKPYMERRTFATFKKQWPDHYADVQIASVLTMKRVGSNAQLVAVPQRITFDQYCRDVFDRDEVINIMVGDLQRIREYPKLGYQIVQDIPDVVWRAYKELVSAGYNKRLATIE